MTAPSVGQVYRDVLEWGTGLPRWQQELLRRVLPERELATSDIEELAEAAVAESEQQPSPYRPLSVVDLPAVAASDAAMALLGITKVRGVNALKSDQHLMIGPQLTVVYGDNGSGKSGYARVLKKVYRARVVEDILGNLSAEQPSLEPSGATFILARPDGEKVPVDWTDGATGLNLGRFAVMDPACAGTYIRGGALAVGPSGIDVPRRFTEELDRVKSHLARLMAASAPNKVPLQRLENETEAGRFIKSLSSGTSDSAVAAFAGLTEANVAELQECERSLELAKAQTLAVRRTQLRSRLRALESFHTRLSSWRDAVSDVAIQAAHSAVSALEDAETAVRAVRTFDGLGMPPSHVQGRPWLELLTAAARYVQTLPDQSATASRISAGGNCVLCWQPLDDQARTRLERFQEHMAGTAVRVQTSASDAVSAMSTRVGAIPDLLSPEDEVILQGHPDSLAAVTALLAQLRVRRDAVATLLRAGTMASDLVSLDELALSAVGELREVTRRDLDVLPTSDAEAERYVTTLEQRALELRTRQAVAESIETVRLFIAATRQRQRLAQAERGINTRAASVKASELHKNHMTARYAALVDEELKGLRFRRRRPILSQATSKGTVQVTPLVSSEFAHIPAEKVFSEGERTAIALACFLAELRLGDDPSGLIFDDPISSLDHNVREHVARRLVGAAKDRQVIVFTHDLAFLADLREQAKKIQVVDCELRTLTATDFDAGFVEEEEPFGARNVGKRIKALRQLLVDVERAAKAGDVNALRLYGKDFYERLRSTWERFVEERLFATVVQRLERNVIVGALSKVAYTRELGEQVHEGWRRCSNALEAHDHAPAAGGQSYSVEEMKTDFQMLLDADAATPKAS